MAAPHAAGAAALIKSAHPDWTPDVIKAAVMQGAVDLGLTPLEQGAGRVDVMKSLNLQAVVLPSSIGLGVLSTDTPVWAHQRTLTIRNLSTEPQLFQMSANTYHAGISVVFTPSSVTVPAGESALVMVDISVDNNIIPEPDQASCAYSFKLLVQSPTQTIIVPVSFLKCAILRLLLPDMPRVLIIHDREGNHLPLARVEEQTLYVKPGQYDVMALFDDVSTLTINEAVVIQEETTYTLNRDNVKNTVNLVPRDNQGGTFIPDYGYCILEHIPSGKSLTLYGSGMPISYRISDMSSNYRWVWGMYKCLDKKRYIARGFHDGINGDIELTNDLSTYKHFTVRQFSHPDTEKHAFNWGLCFYKGSGTDIETNWLYSGWFMNFLTAPFIEEVYANPQVGELNSRCLDSIVVYCYNESQTTAYYNYYSTLLRLHDSGAITGHVFSNGLPEVFRVENGHLSVGFGPCYWADRFVNGSNRIRITTLAGVFHLPFYTQMYDILARTLFIPCEIYRRGQLLKKIDLPWFDTRQVVDLGAVEPDVHTVKLWFDNCYVARRKGTTYAVATFDTRQNDRNPPYIKLFNITSNGHIADKLISGQDNRITVQVQDDMGVASVEILCKSTGDEWIDLPVVGNGDVYTASVPELPFDNYVSLRLRLTDTSGNTQLVDMEPGFLYSESQGDITAPTKPVVMDDGDILNGKTIIHATWQSSDPESEIVEYRWAISETPDESRMLYIEPSDPTNYWQSAGTATEGTRYVYSLKEGHTYYILVKAKNAAGLWSEIGVSDGIKVETSILLVDDSGNSSYRSYYEAALQNYGKPYVVWSTASSGMPTLEYMRDFSRTIWFTGDETTESINSDEASLLKNYLWANGNLFITGQDIEQGSGGMELISHLGASTWPEGLQAEGIVTSMCGLFDGRRISIAGGDGANNQHSPNNLVSQRSDITPVISYDIEGGLVAAMALDQWEFRSVLFAFGFEAISSADDRSYIMNAVLDWLAHKREIEPVSIGGVKGCPDNTFVYLQDRIVSGNFTDCFYVEDPNRSSGIKVFKRMPSYYWEGQKISIKGFLMTLDGERTIVPVLIDEGYPWEYLYPLAMNNRSLGGGPLGLQQGIDGSVGLNNVGLLVKTWGMVTASGRDWFYIDDGTGVRDGTGYRGIYVTCPNMVAPSIGSLVSVTGISSCEFYHEKLVNLLRPRMQYDIDVLMEGAPGLNLREFETESPRRKVQGNITPESPSLRNHIPKEELHLEDRDED